MKNILIALFISATSSAQVIRQNGSGSGSSASVTATGASSTCLSASAGGFNIDCTAGELEQTGAGGVDVTYGILAGTLTVTGPGTTPPALFSPILSSATVSAALSGTFTNTTLGLCVASSTGSLTLPQISDIRFDVHCTISVASLSAVIGAGVIVDGGFIDGETATRGAIAPLEPVSTDGTTISFTVYATGLSAASHSYCFSPFVSANTGTIDSTNSVCHLHAHMMP